jgi:transcriptional repressor NrdR
MQCPFCGSTDSRVTNTVHENGGGIRRRRICKACGVRFTTHERAVLSTPLLVKQDGDREVFDRDKLINGIRMACAKRPVAAADINALADSIERTLQQMSADEVSSRVVGDMVVRGLRGLDEIAYIRYALIYLGLNNLETISREIDKLIGLHCS